MVKHWILVAEDDPLIRKVIIALLEPGGITYLQRVMDFMLSIYRKRTREKLPC